MKSQLKRCFEFTFAGLASLMPASVASRLLFTLRSRPLLTDRWGFHIRPIHYHEPLPDFRRISSEALSKMRVSPAVHYRFDEQCALASRLGDAYGGEIAELDRAAPPEGFDFTNDFFAGLDAAVYYALIRDQRPALVIEIGSGYSTQIASHAILRNKEMGFPGQLICIEPFPPPRLIQSRATFELIQKQVQDVPLDFFDRLKSGDILFIDSSHVATSGGDVNYEFLDILPRLNPGVWVHVHDIFLPCDYPSSWVIERRWAFNEQYMLEAFLAFNSTFSVQLGNAWLWSECSPQARRLYNGPANISPAASFWLKREK